MQVTLKVCNSENNRLTKTFTGASASYNIEMKNNSSVFNPVILIGTTDNLTQYNYAEIDELGRKYFITDITMVRANLYEIRLHVDVLSTYDSQLRGISVVAKRQENSFNMYLPDDNYPVLNKEQIYTKRFGPNAFSKSLSFVLMVAG